jgi:hypothetical protein
MWSRPKADLRRPSASAFVPTKPAVSRHNADPGESCVEACARPWTACARPFWALCPVIGRRRSGDREDRVGGDRTRADRRGGDRGAGAGRWRLPSNVGATHRRSGSRGGGVGPLHRRPLQAFGLAVQVSRWVLASKFPRGMVWDYVRLPDQAQRAAGSVALNIKRPPRLVGSRRRTWRVVCRSPASVIPRPGPCGAGQAEPPYGPSPAARAFAASGFARWSEIAYASASEACSALDPVDLPGATEQQQYLRELGAVRMDAMLTGLMR